jgi:hypothetical protein
LRAVCRALQDAFEEGLAKVQASWALLHPDVPLQSECATAAAEPLGHSGGDSHGAPAARRQRAVHASSTRRQRAAASHWLAGWHRAGRVATAGLEPWARSCECTAARLALDPACSDDMEIMLAAATALRGLQRWPHPPARMLPTHTHARTCGAYCAQQVRPAPALLQMWRGRAQSRRRCGRGRAQSRRRCGRGRAQSRRRCGRGRAQSRRRCGRGEPAHGRYDQAHALLQRLADAQRRTLGRTNPRTECAHALPRLSRRPCPFLSVAPRPCRLKGRCGCGRGFGGETALGISTQPARPLQCCAI